MSSEEASSSEEAVAIKLHMNDGKPCASCKAPLKTGSIRGVICNKGSCKTWARLNNITKSYKKRRPLHPATHENSHPQAAWAESARSKDVAPPPTEQEESGQLVKACFIYGSTQRINEYQKALAFAKPEQKYAGLSLFSRMTTFHVHGLFRSKRSKANDEYDVRWVDQDDLLNVLDPEGELTDCELDEIIATMWRGSGPPHSIDGAQERAAAFPRSAYGTWQQLVVS